jgi:hypothetical protein
VRPIRRITLLGSILGALALATAETSLTCTGAIPTGSGVCFLEQPAASFLGFEVAYGLELGVQAGAVLRGEITAEDVLSLAPYAILGSYQEGYAWWLELRMPQLGIPLLGTTDFLRVGFSLRW